MSAGEEPSSAAVHPAPPPAEEAELQTSAWQTFRADLDRYVRFARPRGIGGRLRLLAWNEGIWAIAVHRLGTYLNAEASAPTRLALKVPYALVYHVVRLAVGVCLDPKARIGPGLYIGHSGGIWVAPGAVLGRGCSLSQGVTIGVGGSVRRGTPVLGDRVWVGPNATICGPIRIGSDAVVGANSLAVTNVPPRGVAIGVPARVVALSGSAAHMTMQDER